LLPATAQTITATSCIRVALKLLLCKSHCLHCFALPHRCALLFADFIHLYSNSSASTAI
jgi:hypothetical protein